MITVGTFLFVFLSALSVSVICHTSYCYFELSKRIEVNRFGPFCKIDRKK